MASQDTAAAQARYEAVLAKAQVERAEFWSTIAPSFNDDFAALMTEYRALLQRQSVPIFAALADLRNLRNAS